MSHCTATEAPFIVPQTFQEFYARFPNYIRAYVIRRNPRMSEDRREDRESALRLHLMTLPENSPYREHGCTDRIAAFHAPEGKEPTKGLLLHWVTTCLDNYSRNLIRHQHLNPLTHQTTVGMAQRGADGRVIGEDYISRRARRHRASIEEHLRIREYEAFVQRHDPVVYRVLRVVDRAGTFGAACIAEGVEPKKARNRLDILYKHYVAGTSPRAKRRAMKPSRAVVLPF